MITVYCDVHVALPPQSMESDPHGEQARSIDVPDVLFCLRSHIVPPEVRMLQLAVASSMDGVLSCDDRLFYQTTLRVARHLHDVGVRVVEVP